MQSREESSRSRRLASPRGGKRPKRVHKPTDSAFFTGPEELKDTGHSAALLAQLKSVLLEPPPVPTSHQMHQELLQGEALHSILRAPSF